MGRKICKTNEEFWHELSKVWDYEKNEKHWLDFTKGSEQKIWVKCNEKDYHGSYYIRCNNFSNGKRCSYCAKKVKLHPKDSFGGVYEDILEEIWDYEKNEVNPYTITPSTSKLKVWIKCSKKDYHGSYDITPNDYTSGKRCPYCHNNRVHPKDSFGGVYEDILEEIWDYEKNEVDPYTIAPKTKRYIWIKCKNDKSHDSFKTKAIDYNLNKKCPTCLKIISESKPKFGEIHSDILKQVWDYEKNKVNPYEINANTKEKLWFKCTERDYHDSYVATGYNFTKGTRCPYCCNNKIHPNDSFGGVYENVLEEIWDYEKNEINPYTISPSTAKAKVWIKCLKKNYHGSYDITPNDYTSGKRCPYCRSLKIHPKDSFGEKYKRILNKIWDFNKNIEDPFNLAIKTHKKAWFKCEKHGSYEREIASASTYEFRCPTCSMEEEESRLQKKVKEYLIKLGYKIVCEQYCSLKPINKSTGRLLRYDIEVVDLKLIIEVHGQQHYRYTPMWHKTEETFKEMQERDNYKKEFAQTNGFEFLEIPYLMEKDDRYIEFLNRKINQIKYNKNK